MAARKAGDLEQARASLDAALAIDPRFTAARLMRESLGESAGADLPPAAEKPAAAKPDANKPDATAKADTYGLLEARAQHRRLDQGIGVARTASASRRLAEATAALDEVVEQDPALPALPEIAAVQVAVKTSEQRRRLFLPVTAASAVGIAFGLVIGVALGLVIVSRPDIAAEPTQTARTEYATPARPETDAQPETPAPHATTGPGEAPAPAETTASGEARAAAETKAPAAPTPAKATAQQESAAPPSAAMVTRSVRPPFTDGDRAARDRVTPSPTRDVAPGETTPPSLTIVEPPRPPAPAASPAPAPTVAEPRAASPPAADAAAASVPVAVAASVPASNEDRLIWETLQRYRRAYNGLDARLVHAICPGLDETALAHAFEGLLSQSLEFESCSLDTQQDSARAVCRGSARYVARVGSRAPRTERLVWAFRLNKSNGNWMITSAWTDR